MHWRQFVEQAVHTFIYLKYPITQELHAFSPPQFWQGAWHFVQRFPWRKYPLIQEEHVNPVVKVHTEHPSGQAEQPELIG